MWKLFVEMMGETFRNVMCHVTWQQLKDIIGENLKNPNFGTLKLSYKDECRFYKNLSIFQSFVIQSVDVQFLEAQESFSRLF